MALFVPRPLIDVSQQLTYRTSAKCSERIDASTESTTGGSLARTWTTSRPPEPRMVVVLAAERGSVRAIQRIRRPLTHTLSTDSRLR
jgi:hypothetical protein